MKKKSITQLQKTLWELCKQIVRKRDGNVCVICGKTGLEGSGWHTGHFIPRSTCGAFLKYDLRNIHSSCYNCNINLGGNGALFMVALEKKYGREYVDGILRDRSSIIKAYDHYQNLIEEYKKILEQM